MDSRVPLDDRHAARANPRGGALPDCEAALACAAAAVAAHGDSSEALKRAARLLKQAGWIPASRFAETLVFTASRANESVESRTTFAAALRAFSAAIERRNLSELACSPLLFEHYRALSVLLGGPVRALGVSLEDLALAGRAVPAASLYPAPHAGVYTPLRIRYERALLPVLRTQPDDAETALAQAVRGLDELQACVAELTGPNPYDMWRLAGGALQALQGLLRGDLVPEACRGAPSSAVARAAALGHGKRVMARLNLLIAEQAQGATYAPPALVRATLAALWQPYALWGLPPNAAAQAELLSDYGLSAAWQIPGNAGFSALWEQRWEPRTPDAAALTGSHAPDPDARRDAGRNLAPGLDQGSEHSEHHSGDGLGNDFRRPTRRIGPLRVDAAAFEDFLQAADASMAALNDESRAARATANGRIDPFAAFRAAQAASQLGTAAWAIGLGGVAGFADAIGLAWRRTAHASSGGGANRSPLPGAMLPARAFEVAGEALRRLLHQIAAGMPPSDPAAPLFDLISAIEGSRRVGGL
jgi:hypothetical protein